MPAPLGGWWWWWNHGLTAQKHRKGHTVPKQVIMIATSIQVAWGLLRCFCAPVCVSVCVSVSKISQKVFNLV